MADRSPIQWTGATWNPIVGCLVKSPGCKKCYAMPLAARLERISLAHEATHGEPGPLAHYRGLTEPSKAGPVWNGKVAMAPDAILMKPLHWKKPRRIFVDAMNDLFFEGVTDEMIDRVFAIMALCPQHTFQILTKRPDRMRAYLQARDGMGNSAICRAINDIPRHLGNRHGALEMPLPNVWLGTSAEDQTRLDERKNTLAHWREGTPAALRFLSCEPMLGPIVICELCARGHRPMMDSRKDPRAQYHAGAGGFGDECGFNGLSWVIAGGESGRGARPMHPDWARSLRDQCAAAGVPFFFKQWGEWAPIPRAVPASPDSPGMIAWPSGKVGGALAYDGVGPGIALFRGTKKITGRLLDGVTHDGMPA